MGTYLWGLGTVALISGSFGMILSRLYLKYHARLGGDPYNAEIHALLRTAWMVLLPLLVCSFKDPFTEGMRHYVEMVRLGFAAFLFVLFLVGTWMAEELSTKAELKAFKAGMASPKQ